MKQFSVSTPTARLALTYLAIIMSLTIVFSAVIYRISSAQFDRPLPQRAQFFDAPTRGSLQDIFQDRADQARTDLIATLIVLNLVTLSGGAVLSLYLARKTLEPIEAAMEAQSRFVSDASHELRTPLTALQVTNEVALRKKKLTLEQARDLIAENVSETVKLRMLTDSLLGLVKQESEQRIRSAIDVAAVCNDVIHTFQPVAREQQVMLKCSGDGIASANPAAVQQILHVCIDNAIKYSPTGGEVKITIETNDQAVVIAVRDTGPGIAVADHAHIFERFWRADTSRSSRHIAGNGLGLSIAKTIAERQGYDIAVQSELGQGATFILTIPRV